MTIGVKSDPPEEVVEGVGVSRLANTSKDVGAGAGGGEVGGEVVMGAGVSVMLSKTLAVVATGAAGAATSGVYPKSNKSSWAAGAAGGAGEAV